MIRSVPILTTPLIAVFRFDHPQGHEHSDPREEVSECHSVNFVERGGFTLRAKKQEWRLAPGMVFSSGPGQAYNCRHSERHPSDVCLSVGYSPDFAQEAVHESGVHPKMAFHVRRQSNRLAYLKLLMQGAASQPGQGMAAESLGAEILSALWSPDAGPTHAYRQGQLAWYAARISAACEFLRSEFGQDHSLSSLGRRFGMSPFHFARVFRELAGMPPHQYLLSVRLREAARRLRDGDRVTDACFASGFSHLSHFGRVFQRRFGVLPSQYPKSGGRRQGAA